MPLNKKRYFVFFDGTWETESDKSNVWQIYNALQADATTNTTKIYSRGIGNKDDYKKFQQYYDGGTGDGSLRFAQHSVDEIEKARIQLGLKPDEMAISTMGFSRGSTSATYFIKMMKSKGYFIDTIMLFDRVRSEHLEGRVETVGFNMDLPDAEATLHLVSAHDKRVFPNPDFLPDEFDLLSFFNPEFLWQHPANASKVREIFMPGVHSDIGGKSINEPQCKDSRRVASYFLLLQGFKFDIAYLNDLLSTESQYPPVQHTKEYDSNDLVDVALNDILYHDREAKVLNQKGEMVNHQMPIIHSRVFDRLTQNQVFVNTKKPYEIPFLNKNAMIQVVDDNGNMQTKFRYTTLDHSWHTLLGSQRAPDPLFNFAKGRAIAQSCVQAFRRAFYQMQNFAPRQGLPTLYGWSVRQGAPVNAATVTHSVRPMVLTLHPVAGLPLRIYRKN